jgi:hypothetical protein
LRASKKGCAAGARRVGPAKKGPIRGHLGFLYHVCCVPAKRIKPIGRWLPGSICASTAGPRKGGGLTAVAARTGSESPNEPPGEGTRGGGQAMMSGEASAGRANRSRIVPSLIGQAASWAERSLGCSSQSSRGRGRCRCQMRRLSSLRPQHHLGCWGLLGVLPTASSSRCSTNCAACRLAAVSALAYTAVALIDLSPMNLPTAVNGAPA